MDDENEEAEDEEYELNYGEEIDGEGILVNECVWWEINNLCIFPDEEEEDGEGEDDDGEGDFLRKKDAPQKTNFHLSISEEEDDDDA